MVRRITPLPEKILERKLGIGGGECKNNNFQNINNNHSNFQNSNNYNNNLNDQSKNRRKNRSKSINTNSCSSPPTRLGTSLGTAASLCISPPSVRPVHPFLSPPQNFSGFFPIRQPFGPDATKGFSVGRGKTIKKN